MSVKYYFMKLKIIYQKPNLKPSDQHRQQKKVLRGANFEI